MEQGKAGLEALTATFGTARVAAAASPAEPRLGFAPLRTMRKRARVLYPGTRPFTALARAP